MEEAVDSGGEKRTLMVRVAGRADVERRERVGGALAAAAAAGGGPKVSKRLAAEAEEEALWPLDRRMRSRRRSFSRRRASLALIRSVVHKRDSEVVALEARAEVQDVNERAVLMREFELLVVALMGVQGVICGVFGGKASTDIDRLKYSPAREEVEEPLFDPAMLASSGTFRSS